ncbi:FBH1-like protein [Mya arenaria]|uniref:FBH1-like protein n=1 Tax=Mya arenaria TaxID=6604 RepID=A0ABY7G0R0_MYAAR|nr:FBH1-like protein [Mya arenaria]
MCDKFNQDVQCNQIQVKCEVEVASSDQNKESQSNIVCNNVEVSLNQRRKRLHMGIVTCDEVGNASLAEPQDLTRNTERTDVNRGLYPVVRNKRRKIDTGNDDVQLNHNAACPGFMPASQAHGFVSASNMYRIDNYSRQNNASPANTSHSNSSSPRKPQKKIKQILNQGSIMNFISLKPSTPDKTHRSNGIKEEKVELDTKNEKVSATTAEQKDDDDDDDDISALYTGRSVMFSPIKKQGSDDDSTACIYISDSSPSSSPASSQGSRTNSQRSTVANNVVVKRLFEAQKTVDKNVPQKGPMKRKSISQKPSTLPFISKNELSNLKTEAAKYFENDSFDMNAVFNSDMEDFADSPKPPIPVSKATKSDKYGLLGTGSYPRENSEKVNYFERLPPEVLENIFCQLPMLDLSLNSNRVCSQWNSIIGNEKIPNPWSVIALLVILAPDVYEIQEIMSCLSIPTSQCTAMEIIECLYCIACFLFAFKLAKRADVWNGFAHKLGNLKVYTLTQALQARKGINLYLQAKFVMTTLENYFASADEAISMEHVPSEQMDEKTGLKTAIALGEKRSFRFGPEIAHVAMSCLEGTDNFGFPMLMDMYSLTLPQNEREKEGHVVKNKFVAMFKTLGDLEKFATKSLDVELQGKIKIVKTYHHNLPVTVRVTDDFAGDISRAIIVMPNPVAGLADLARGWGGEENDREEDLNYIAVRPSSECKEDEHNLLYVAVTRAKNALQMSPTLLTILKRAGVSSVGSEEGADGTVREGGVYSPALLTEDSHSMAELLGLSPQEIKEKQKLEEKL